MENGENGWKWMDMAGNGFKLFEKFMEIGRYGWNWLNKKTGNCWKLMEIDGNGWI